MNVFIWIYVASRVLVDLAALYKEDMLTSFIRTELFMDPTKVSAAVYPLAVLYLLVDLGLNRLITSAGLCLSTMTYTVLNFVSTIVQQRISKRCAKIRKITTNPFRIQQHDSVQRI